MNPVKYVAGFLFPFVLISCTAADHRIPTEINVERGEFGPKHNLYQHHDIMLLGDKKGFNEAVGMTPDLKVLVDGDEALALSQSTETKKKVKTEKSSTPAQTTSELWRKRVYVKGQRDRVNVFDISKIQPKLGATRPAWLGDAKADRPCQKPLREREITRLGKDGKAVRSYRQPGLVN